MHDHRPLLSSDPFSEGPDESHERLRWLGHAEIGPRGEVKVADSPHGVAPHHAELGDVPIGEVTFVEYGHLDVPIENGLSIVRPVVVALFAAFLHAPG